MSYLQCKKCLNIKYWNTRLFLTPPEDTLTSDEFFQGEHMIRSDKTDFTHLPEITVINCNCASYKIRSFYHHKSNAKHPVTPQNDQKLRFSSHPITFLRRKIHWRRKVTSFFTVRFFRRWLGGCLLAEIIQLSLYRLCRLCCFNDVKYSTWLNLIIAGLHSDNCLCLVTLYKHNMNINSAYTSNILPNVVKPFNCWWSMGLQSLHKKCHYNCFYVI